MSQIQTVIFYFPRTYTTIQLLHTILKLGSSLLLIIWARSLSYISESPQFMRPKMIYRAPFLHSKDNDKVSCVIKPFIKPCTQRIHISISVNLQILYLFSGRKRPLCCQWSTYSYVFLPLNLAKREDFDESVKRLKHTKQQ